MQSKIELGGLLDLLDLQPGERLSFSAYAPELGGFISAQFAEQEAAEAWVARAAAVGGSVWVTPNPTREGAARAKDADVTAKRWQLVDFDPCKTPDDPNGLDAAKREACKAAARELWADVEERGVLVSSGRGWQVWLRVADDVDRLRLRDWACARWGERGVYEVDKLGQDPSRLCRCPGVANPRTGEVAYIEGEPSGGVISAADVEAWSPDWVAPVDRGSGDGRGWDQDDPTPADMGLVEDKARALWDDEMVVGDGRSGRLHAFLCEILKAGADVDSGQACRLWWALPGGKASEENRDAGYWAQSLASAERSVGEADAAEQADADTLALALQECEDANSGAPAYAKEVLKAASRLRGRDRGAFNDWRLRLMRTRLVSPMKDWDKELSRVAAMLRRESGVQEPPPDKVVRRIENDAGEFVGWLRLTGQGDRCQWLPNDQTKIVLEVALGPDRVKPALDAAIKNSWRVVNVPYEQRELDGRRWNMTRSQHIAPEAGDFPEWLRMFAVIGRGLDDAVAASEWCQEHGVRDGGAYLALWVACMFQEPFKRVPWLFLYSADQGKGKSTFVEAIKGHLLTGGAVCINRWLTGEREFNEEAEGCVLAYVEEANIAQHRDRAYNRAKVIVTNDEISWEGKGKTPHDSANTLHVIQMANDPRYMVLRKGDKRVTAWEMLPFRPEDVRDKADMNVDLAEQAPAFMHYLLSLDLPARGDGRLAIPVLDTELKRTQSEASRDVWERYLELTPHWVGWSIEALHEDFVDRLPRSETRAWPLAKVESAMDKQPTRLRKAWRLAGRLYKRGDFEGLVADLAGDLCTEPRELGRLLAILADRTAGVTAKRTAPGKWVSISAKGLRRSGESSGECRE